MRLNLKFLLILLLVMIVLGASYFGVHAYQVRRQAGALLQQGIRAEQQGQLDRAERYLRRFLLLRPQDAEGLARYALVLDKVRATSPAGRRLMDVFEHALLRNPERHDLRRRLAERDMDLGRFNDALVHLRVLLEAFPNDADLTFRLGRCQEGMAEYQQAAATYAAAIRLAPQEVKSYARRAAVLRQRLQQTVEADQVIADMVAANPKSFEAYLERATYRRQQSQSAALAAQDVEEALRLNPKEGTALRLAATLAQDQQKWDEARGYLRQALQQHPKDVNLYQALVRLELRAGRRNEAAAAARKGLQAVPNEPNLLWTLADLHIQADELNDAQALLEPLRKTPLPAPRVEFLQAALYTRQGKWREACQALRDIRPKLADAPELARQADLLLGQCYSHLDDPQEQLAAFRRVSASDGSLPAARFGTIAALLRLGQLDQAVSEARELTRFSRMPAAGWVTLARLLVQHNLRAVPAQRNWPEVESVLRKAAATNSDDPAVVVLRAEVLEAQEQFAPARQLLEAARQKQPQKIEYWLALAKLAGQEGRLEAFLQVLTDAERQLGDRVDFRLLRLNYLAERNAPDLAKVFARTADGLEKFPPAERDRLLRGLATVEQRLGHVPEARRLWRQVADQQPGDIDVRTILFDLALQADDEAGLDHALAEIKRLEGADGPLGNYGEACRLIRLARRGDRSHLARAREVLALAAKQRPAWPRVLLRLAEIDDLEGQPERSLENYLRAIDMGEREPGMVRRVVQRLNELHQYAQAEQVLRKLQEYTPLTGDLQVVAVGLALENLQPERAATLAQAMVPTDSKDFRDHLWLGQVYWAAGRKAEAEAELGRAVQLNRTEAGPWIALVRFQVGTGQKDKAEATLQEARTKVAPVQAPLVLAHGYEALGRLDLAHEQFRLAVAARPDDVPVVMSVAQFYLRAGQASLAVPYLRKILDPKFQVTADARTWARRRLAVALVEGGGYRAYREALALLDQDVQANGSSLDEERARAMVLGMRPGRRRRAIELFEALAKRAPLTADEQFFLARLYEADNNWARAREGMSAVVSANSANAGYLATYLGSLLRRGLAAEAREWVARLKAVKPDGPEAATLEARLLSADGRDDEAVALLKRYVANDQAEPRTTGGRLRIAARVLDELSQADALLHGSLGEVAAEMYRTAAQANAPQDFLALASHLGRRKRLTEALELCDRAAPAATPDSVARTVAAVLLAVVEDEALSRQLEHWLDMEAKRRPRMVVFRLLRGELYIHRGRFGEAETEFRQVLQRDSRNVEALLNVAYLLAQRGADSVAALVLLREAAEAGASGAGLLDTRGVVRLAQGQTAEAIADLEEAVADVPTASRYLHLAMAYQKFDRRADALAALQKAKSTGLVLRRLHPTEREAYRQLEAEQKGR
jgi:tetratricopeptide (TPR) repeat protein